MARAPYKVAKGGKNAIVLKVCPDHIKYLANCPDSVEILIGKKNVAGLMFLHTGGWTNGLKPFGWRQIHYTDGTKEVMALNNTNFADWNYGHDDFPDEDGTTTWVAWKGACKNYPITRVYGTLWVNPHPEKEIAKIVSANAGLPLDERRFHCAHRRDPRVAEQGQNRRPDVSRRQEVAGPLTGGTDAPAGQQTGRGSGDT